MNIVTRNDPSGWVCYDADQSDGEPGAIVGIGPTKDDALDDFWLQLDPTAVDVYAEWRADDYARRVAEMCK